MVFFYWLYYYRYNELYKQAGGGRGKIIDREKFSEYFNLPVALGDRLFDAFDKKQVSISHKKDSSNGWGIYLGIVVMYMFNQIGIAVCVHY